MQGTVAAAACLVLAVVLLVRWLWRRKRAKELEATRAAAKAAEFQRLRSELEGLLPLAAAGGTATLDQLQPGGVPNDQTGKWWRFVVSQDEALIDRFKQAVAEGRATEHFAKHIGPMTARWEACRATPDSDLGKQIAALAHFLHDLHDCRNRHIPGSKERIEEALGVTWKDAQALLNSLLPQQLSALLERAKKGEREAFIAAEDLVSQTWGGKSPNRSPLFYGLGVDGLPKPDSWNTLVVRFHRSPRWEQFATGGLEWRDMIALAADAVQDHDEVPAQMVLASCEVNNDVRRQVGDVRHVQLADIAAQAWQARHEQVATTE